MRSASATLLAVLLCGFPALGGWEPAPPAKPIYNPNTQYDPAVSTGRYYAYAPSVVRVGNIIHYWSCHNTTSDVIIDSIVHVKWDVTANSLVTSPTGTGKALSDVALGNCSAGADCRTEPLGPPPAAAETWDGYHNCDPSVVTGSFKLNNQTYSHAMFYTANYENTAWKNQIGVAFSNSLDGPWVKYGNPIVDRAAIVQANGFDARGAATGTCDGHPSWGAGQPSATHVAGAKVLLFYSYGEDGCGTTTRRLELDLSSLCDFGVSGCVAVPAHKSDKVVTVQGLSGSDGVSGGWADPLHNADFAYSAATQRFYIARSQHGHSLDAPPANIQLASIPETAIWGGGGTWTVEGTVNRALTALGTSTPGTSLSTEPALEKDVYGGLADPQLLTVVFSRPCDDNCGLLLDGPRLWSMSGALHEGAVENLALAPDAVITGNARDFTSAPRGLPGDIVYDTTFNRYANRTAYNEYGLAFGQDAGRALLPGSFSSAIALPESQALYWRVDWGSPKPVSYLSLAGAFANQPQPQTAWKIEYKCSSTSCPTPSSAWYTLEQSTASGGGWVNGGSYVYDNPVGPLQMDALRVKVFSRDAVTPVKSFSFRGRGGVSYESIAPSENSGPKAVVIQNRHY